MSYPFQFAPPFNIGLALQFVRNTSSIKDDLLDALELQITNGDGGYSWWTRTAVDQIRLEFKKVQLSKHEATTMYLSRLYELKPMWWSVTGMNQLDRVNNLVDEMALTMRSRLYQIVESGIVTPIPLAQPVPTNQGNFVPQQQQQSVPSFKTTQQQSVQSMSSPTPQPSLPKYDGYSHLQSVVQQKSNVDQRDQFYKPYEPKIEKRIIEKPKEVLSKKLEPSTAEIFTMEEMNMVVETDLNAKENDLLVRIRNLSSLQETTFGFSLVVKDTKLNSRTKCWNSSIIIEQEGIFQISLEHFGNIIWKENKTLVHRLLSLQNSFNQLTTTTWNRKCKVGEACTVVVPCVNANNSPLVKQFNIVDVKATVKCGSKEMKCHVSHQKNSLLFHLQNISVVGNAQLNVSFEDQSICIPFSIEYKDIDWEKTCLVGTENMQIQDSKWMIREKCLGIKMILKIVDMKEKPIQFFDPSQYRARLHTHNGTAVDCLLEFLTDQSSIQLSFNAPAMNGPAYLTIHFNSLSTALLKFPIEILKTKTLQIGIIDQKGGIGESVKEKLKYAVKQSCLNLNFPKCSEVQKPDIVLHFIYHNGPPTWSDYTKILADDHKMYEGASVIMVLATNNKQNWKKYSPDHTFPSGVNLSHSNNSIHKRGVVWIYYDLFSYSIGDVENDSEIENLLQLLSFKI